MSRVLSLYERLSKTYGNPGGQWNLWCKRPKSAAEKEEVIIGAILTQRTNWKNVMLAIEALRSRRLLSLEKIHALGDDNREELARCIRASGFYRTKARYLREIARFFIAGGCVARVAKLPHGTARRLLLELPGVGPETADSILLYALEKPVFVIDEYTRRLAQRERLTDTLSYAHLQAFFERGAAGNCALYQDFHALIVMDGKARASGTAVS